MSMSVICFKATTAELVVIDTILRHARLKSRSDVIRTAVQLLAERWDVDRDALIAAGDERAKHPPICRASRQKSRLDRAGKRPMRK